MLLKVYKSRVWVLLFMLLPFVGNAQLPADLPTGWEFTENPTSGVYAIQLSVSYDGVDPLAADDWVGAFYDDDGVMECAGAAKWTGTENIAVVVFGNDTLAGDKNGFSDGEMITWMFYRDATGTEEEVCIDPDPLFWANGVLDEIEGFKSCQVCQEIELGTGFQFISSYVAAPDPDMVTVMGDVLDNLEFARNGAGDQVFFFFGGWQNGIGDWVNEEGYIVKMTGPDVLEICGQKVDPQTPIDLNTGFQFVSYLDSVPQNALVAFDGILDNLEFVRNSAGDQIFFFFGGWQNGIGDVEPGEGYIVKMAGDDQLIYPPVESMGLQSMPQSKTKELRGVNWPSIQGLASDPIWTIYIAEAQLDGVSLEAGDELAIFDDGTLVGSTVLAEAPNGGFNLNLDLKAWHTINESGDGFTFGAPFTVKCWDASEDVESLEFTYSYQTAPGAYEGDVFPDGDAISVMEFYFTGPEPEQAPELISAIGIDEAVELTWEPIGADNMNDGVYWPSIQGLASDPIWTIYIAIADLNGVSLEAGDELAIYDDATLVGSTVLAEAPNGGFNLNLDLKAWHTINESGDGFTFGAPFTVKCWDASEDLESTAFTYAYQTAPGAYEGDVFPDGDAISVMEFHFTADAPYTPTFNIYVDDALTEEGVEGNTFTVEGLTNGQEYCFQVSQILEDGSESGLSNTECATPEADCEDVVINNFPAAPDNVCFGTPVEIDFSGVEILNAASFEYAVDPEEAGAIDGDTFYLDDMYVGVVTITLDAEATPPCNGASEELSFEVYPLPVFDCPAYGPFCEGDENIMFMEDGEFFYNSDLIDGWNPAVAGTFDITYVYTDPDTGCSDECMFEIVVNPLPIVECPGYEPICVGFGFEFPEVENGVYTNSAGDEVFGIDADEPGTFEFTLTVTNDFECSASCTFEIVVNPSPVAECPEFDPVCAGTDEIPFDLELGTYYDADGNPVESFDPAEGGEYVFTLVVENDFGCQDECEFWITVYDLPEVTCPDDMVYLLDELPVTLEGATPEDGTYSGAGVEDGVFFVEEEGDYEITYTYTDVETGCTNFCTFIITVGEVPCPVINNFPEFQEDVCAGTELVIDFSGVEILNAEDVIWEVDPVEAGEYVGTDFVLNTDYVGMVTLTLTAVAEEPCEDATAALTFMVNELPDVTLAAYEPVCEGSGEFELYGGKPEGGMYYVDGEEATMFDPAVAGTYVVEYFYTDENGCTNSAVSEIVVNPNPVPECPAYEPVCEGSEYIMFPEVEGGVYTDMDDMVVEGFDPMMAGTYMFTLTVTNEFGCSAFCEFEIVVNPLPYIELELSANEICLGDEVTGTITGPADGAYPYTVEYTINGEMYTDMIEGTPLELPLVPDMPGLYTLEVLSVVDANGCVALPVEGVELDVLPLPEITMQPMSLEVLWGESAEFMVEAEYATGYQWYFNGEMIEGATDATYAIEVVSDDDAGEYYVMVMGDCGEVMSDVVTLTVNPWTQIIDFNGLVNGMSTYLSLTEDQLDMLFAELLDEVVYVEFKNPDQAWSPLNASFAFDEEQGAKVVLNGGFPTSIEVTGYPTLGTMVDLSAGNNFLPVYSQDVVLADDVFGPLGDDLFAVFSLDYSGFWWPEYSLYTLEYLVPGSSYLVIMNAAATADFDVPAVDANPGYADVPRNVTTWQDATLTGTQHNIAITADALSQIQVGDVIGAFNEYGQISGMVEVTNTRDNIVLRTFGDNTQTKRAEGFVEGDMMTIKVWRDGEEMIAEATFDAKMPNQNIFAKDGVSAITNLKLGATSVNDLTAGLEASLYPNPATDVVNIQTNFEIENIKVVNYVGQVVLDQDVNQINYQINTSDYRSGMYFVQIANNEGVVITKRLTIK